jgi:hypothetical protein
MRELGLSAVEISKKLNITSSTASESVTRGRQIVEEQELTLLDKDIEYSENPRNVPELPLGGCTPCLKDQIIQMS